MSTIATHPSFSSQEPGYRVVATLGWHLLPQVRDALALICPSPVLVFAAQSWNDGGDELSYRGQRVRVDRKVARVELTCLRQHVDPVVSAIETILARAGAGRAGGAVFAYCVSTAA